MNSIFFRLDDWILAAILTGALLVAWWAGVRVGRRLRDRLGQTVPGGGKIEDACLALLGLLLAFSFATACARFDDRRSMVVKEANTIATFATQSQLLIEPYRSRVQSLLREYVRLRAAPVRIAGHSQAWDAHDRQTRALEDQIQRQVLEAAGQMPPTAVLAGIVAAMNQMIAEYAARVAVVLDRVPYAVLALLCLVSLISTFLLARAQGISEKHQPLTMAVFIVLVASVFEVTLDLDQPHRGLIQVSQEPMSRLVESLGASKGDSGAGPAPMNVTAPAHPTQPAAPGQAGQ